MNKSTLLLIACMAFSLVGWAQSKSVDFQSTDIKTSGQVQFKAEEQTLEISSDFQTQEGPNLHVYLATDTTAKDFTDLGELKSLSGEQSYQVPADASVEEQSLVLIYCQEASHLFGYAALPVTNYDTSQR